ncbi:MAG TPA: glycosyltransferase [Gemmatimonadaceae bacterium]|nr:glycosyltransferase [Gemmatimonadaceae bacterium]
MATGPAVSVITIFLNAERFIEDAIDSVVRQTFDDWELLLVDDGSTDASTRIAKGYAARFPDKIRYLEHPGHVNKGMSASRNLGLHEARGEFVGFLDADDVWLPYKLEEQVAIMRERADVTMLYGYTQYWHSWNGEPRQLGHDRVSNPGVPLDTVIEPPALLTTLYPLGGASAPSMSNILIRRSNLLELGGFEESFRGLYEDQVFLAKAYLTQRVLVTGRLWDRYRRHDQSCVVVATEAGQYHPLRKRYLEWLSAYLERERVDSPRVQKALRYALWPYRHPWLNYLAGPISDPPARVLTMGFIKRTAHRLLPKPIVGWLRRLRHNPPVPVGAVRMGALRRLEPLSRDWGFDRGRPVDRYYIERFLSSYSGDIRGTVLEVADDTYTTRFGGDKVQRREVLDLSPRNPAATIVGDLSQDDLLPDETFDCMIVTQTLQLVYDIPKAVGTLYRALKPGGVLLVTVPGISQIARDGREQWNDCWRFTDFSARRLFAEHFPPESLDVQAHGNVLVASAFLQGMAVEDLRTSELEHRDRDYQLVITIRAAKPAAGK